MDHWDCDRRNMRMNDLGERIAAAAYESLIRRTSCFVGLNLNIEALHFFHFKRSHVDLITLVLRV
jgi:hypothetical protein